MAGYLAFYRELSSRGRRIEIESFMREELVDLWSHRAVVACAGRKADPELTLTHFTIDDPVAYSGGLLLQFTYQLRRRISYRNLIEVISGSGLAWIDDNARVRLDDVEAVLNHLMVELEPDEVVVDDLEADAVPMSGRVAVSATSDG